MTNIYKFIAALIAVVILIPNQPAAAQNDLPRQRCIDQPTVPCLIDLVLSQIKSGDLPNADMSSLFGVIAQIQANSGDLAGAIETASNLSARELLMFTTEVLKEQDIGASDMSPIRLTAEAILKASRASKISSKTLEAEALAAQILARIGAIDAALEYVRGLRPEGNRLGQSRDPTISQFVWKLMKDGHLVAAETLAAEMVSARWREQMTSNIARHYLYLGKIAPAMALLKKIAGSGRAAVAIDLAKIRHQEGKTAEVLRLLSEAKTALATEKSPLILVLSNIRIGFILFNINDVQGSTDAFMNAMSNLNRMEEPMSKFFLTVAAVALQSKLGHPQQALETLKTAVEGRTDDYLFGRIASAGHLTDEGYISDARKVLSSALRAMEDDKTITRSDAASLYLVQAARALTQSCVPRPRPRLTLDYCPN